MSKATGINKPFLSITAEFIDVYTEIAKDVGLIILLGSLVNKKLIEDKVVKILTPLINDYFSDSIAASNRVVKASISKLTDQLDVPFKYNKDLLDKVNNKSIWTGYYDVDIKSGFSKREITSLKKTILSAKYGDWTEKEMISGIKNVVRITDNRARLLARSATTGLETTANQIYFGKQAVRNAYELVWSQNSPYERHRHMNGVEADENGMFLDSKTGKLIPGPPYQDSPWNCLCTTYFRERET